MSFGRDVQGDFVTAVKDAVMAGPTGEAQLVARLHRAEQDFLIAL